MIKIKLVSISDILENETSFNTNHHFISEDYEEEIGKTEFKNYMHILDRECTYVDLSLIDCKTILKACASGVITLKSPEMYQEEFDMIAKKIILPYTCFVRLERCSLKDSCYGAGPYTRSIDILNALSTSYRCFNYITKSIDKLPSIRLYILPWVPNIKEESEFRIFVHNKSITSLSQYSIYNQSQYIKADWTYILSQIQKLVSNISKNTTLSSYTMDVCLIENKILLLELNSFGANMAAGSCLFNWIDDENQLYGKTNFIEIRLVGTP